MSKTRGDAVGATELPSAPRSAGRFNLAQGAVATTQGVGTALSGLFVDHLAIRRRFSPLPRASIAWAAFVVFIPETRNDGAVERERDAAVALREPAGDGI